MREIKFRAWDEILHKIVEGGFIEESIQPDDMPVYHTGLSYGMLFVGRYDLKGDWIELPLMQFTGLSDKNGNEIYEGDILRDGTDMQFPITVDATHGYRFMFGLDTLVAYNAISGEIIGNIYETQQGEHRGKLQS